MSHGIGPINAGGFPIRPVNDIKFHADTAHYGFPDHMDVISRMAKGFEHKLRVDGDGNILTDDLIITNKYLNKIFDEKKD